MPLAPKLQALGQYQQFVNWKLEPGSPKPVKVPVDVSGKKIDAHNPAHWLTVDQAYAIEAAMGFGVAFVLSDNDPFAVVDLDHCRDENGNWSQFAVDTCKYFEGATTEVSQSGNGLHIWMYGRIPEGYQTKNQGIGLEAYSRLRMMCLGGREVWNDNLTKLDYTNHLAQFVPHYMKPSIGSDLTVNDNWTTEPRPEYTGPEDDDQLIQKALATQTAANTFGAKASFKDLWTANVDKLRDAYPDNSPEREYDASSADLALATHLAFWTGGNCERIERLMWKSALTRDKWTKHKSYLRDRTILYAVNGCNNVYDYLAPSDNEHSSSSGIRATPYKWINPKDIPPRQWIYAHALIRGFVSLLIAPGASGKSTLLIGEALAIATGRNLLGSRVYGGPKRVWLWNLEDPKDELQRRVTGAIIHYKLTSVDLDARLYLDSGRDQELCVARQSRSGFEIIEPIVSELICELKRRQIDVLIVDPFVSSHQVPENDNGAIDAVAKTWAKIAHDANCSIVLVHHLRKLGGESANAEAARGASALVAAARSVRVINRMSKSEAENAGLESANGFFKIFDDKNNLSPAESENANWFRIRSTTLANGDFVGVVEQWQWPEISLSFGPAEILRAQEAISVGRFRESDQSPDWAGYKIGTALGIDTSVKHEKRFMKKMIAQWVSDGFLKITEGLDQTRKARKFIEVGESISVIAPPIQSGALQGGALVNQQAPPPQFLNRG